MRQRAEQAGAVVKTSSAVHKITNDYVSVGDEQYYYKYLVGADGSCSLVRRYLRLATNRIMPAIQYLVPQTYPSIEFYLNDNLFGSGYAWIFPYKSLTSVGVGLQASLIKNYPLKQNFHKWLDKLNIDVVNAQLEGWTINYDYQGFDFGKVFLAGEAAGLTSGLTGEGIYSAIVSGEEIAKKIINPSYDCPRIKKWILVKNTQEKILDILQNHKYLRKMAFLILPLLLQSRKLTDKTVEIFG